MGPQFSQPADDDTWTDGQSTEDEGRPSSTSGIGSMVAPAADDETAPPTRPTFTARAGEPPTAAVPEPSAALDDTPKRDSGDSTGPEDADSRHPALRSSDLMSTDGDRPRERPLPTMNGLDEPLLADAAALRERWQRVQAGFVDDPKEAVGDAADLIEQTAQALVGALRQRQRELRVLWERGPVAGNRPDGPPPADGESAGGADTEHLRQLMRRYRTLFNELCRP